MSRTDETRLVKWHETCKCKCRLDASACNNKQHWNKDKCRCECKELTNKGIFDKRFFRFINNYKFFFLVNNCDCEYDNSCHVVEYLDYENCKFRKKLVDKLVEECSKNIDENEISYSGILNDYGRLCSSYAIYIALFVIVF